MLKLKRLPKENKTAHFELLSARFYEKKIASIAALKGAKYSEALIDYLEKSLETILIGTPGELEAIANTIRSRFTAFSSYAAKRKKSADKKYEVHKNTLKIIGACFDYSWFSNQKNGWGAYALVKAYNLRTCPYCQANHVNFHFNSAKGSKTGSELQLRPPLDHYLPKAVYPYLAVSMSNLVPSCAQCNSGIKATGDPRNKGLAHPLDETPISIKFSFEETLPGVLLGKLKVDEWKLTLTGSDEASSSHVSEFRLAERYEWYRHEINDLIHRHDQHKNINRRFLEVIPRELYVLGFLEESANTRLLGLCLLDLYKDLARY